MCLFLFFSLTFAFAVVLQAAMSCHDDLVGKTVFARLRDVHHPEWQQCTVVQLVDSGIKVKSRRSHEVFLIANNDVCEDLRLRTAFLPYERDQKPYDGKLLLFTLVK